MADIRVGAIDHHPLTLLAIEVCLDGATGLALVGAAADELTALRMVRNEKPDVLVLDVDLPGAPGVALASQIRSVFPTIALLATYEHLSFPHAHALIEMGARGYISNTIDPRELVRAVRSLAAGDTVFGGEVMRGLTNDQAKLTPREREVLERAAKGEGNARIARHLDLSERTVEYHLTHAYAKLGASGRIEAVSRARELGVIVVSRQSS